MYEIAGVLGDSVQTVEENYLKFSPTYLRGAVDFRDRGGAANDAGNAQLARNVGR